MLGKQERESTDHVLENGGACEVCPSSSLRTQGIYLVAPFRGNMYVLAFYISESVKTLVPRAKELAIDATFGTNNMGMHLFAVLAELDGTGIPLAYCFMGIFSDNSHGVRQADPGVTTGLLDQFLRPLHKTGFNPTFFGTDKDFSEISVIRQVRPNVSIQLCYWHA